MAEKEREEKDLLETLLAALRQAPPVAAAEGIVDYTKTLAGALSGALSDISAAATGQVIPAASAPSQATDTAVTPGSEPRISPLASVAITGLTSGVPGADQVSKAVLNKLIASGEQSAGTKGAATPPPSETMAQAQIGAQYPQSAQNISGWIPWASEKLPIEEVKPGKFRVGGPLDEFGGGFFINAKTPEEVQDKVARIRAQAKEWFKGKKAEQDALDSALVVLADENASPDAKNRALAIMNASARGRGLYWNALQEYTKQQQEQELLDEAARATLAALSAQRNALGNAADLGRQARNAEAMAKRLGWSALGERNPRVASLLSDQAENWLRIYGSLTGAASEVPAGDAVRQAAALSALMQASGRAGGLDQAQAAQQQSSEIDQDTFKNLLLVAQQFRNLGATAGVNARNLTNAALYLGGEEAQNALNQMVNDAYIYGRAADAILQIANRVSTGEIKTKRQLSKELKAAMDSLRSGQNNGSEDKNGPYTIGSPGGTSSAREFINRALIRR